MSSSGSQAALKYHWTFTIIDQARLSRKVDAMSLEGKELHRFQMLQGSWIDHDYLHEYYGLGSLPNNLSLRDAVERIANGQPAERDGSFNRYAIELFFTKNKLRPKKWMAAELGMTIDFLDIVLDRIDELPVPRRNYLLFEALVDERLRDDLVTNLPSLRFRTFYDHESFCRRTHEALAEALQLSEQQVSDMSLWCATDQWLDRTIGDADYPRRYALHFDCVTCEPLSVAHAVWLDFRKPLSLGPDRCSKLTYVKHLDELQPFLAGTRPPDDLERYERATETAGA